MSAKSRYPAKRPPHHSHPHPGDADPASTPKECGWAHGCCCPCKQACEVHRGTNHHVGSPITNCICDAPMYAARPRMTGSDHSRLTKIHCRRGHGMLVCINCDYGIHEDETPERIAQHEGTP